MNKKMRKSQKGFTLVEVIVVAVIVAVLAAVAIPLYMGYIRDSRANVCQNTAASIASALVARVQQGQPVANVQALVPNGATTVTIPSITDAAGTNSTIVLPAGYTASATATAVTVTHTVSGANASVNWQ